MHPAHLIVVSAAIIGLLGVGHLLLTYIGPRLLPRDRTLRERMDATHPDITTQTTIWRMWIGFNVSHSLGAMLFGAVYSYLAVVHGDLLLQSDFLLLVGFLMVATFCALGKRYWFITPFAASLVSLLCFVAAVVTGRLM